MLARQVLTALLARAWNQKAASFTAPGRFGLENFHFEAALCKFLGGTQPAHATAKYYNAVRHGRYVTNVSILIAATQSSLFAGAVRSYHRP